LLTGKYFCIINLPMAVIIILLIASISVASIFLIAFLWSVRNKQFEDYYSPAVRILFESPVNEPPATNGMMTNNLVTNKSTVKNITGAAPTSTFDDSTAGRQLIPPQKTLTKKPK
jgi:cbb3-type cytochrome oxidase maturation protein